MKSHYRHLNPQSDLAQEITKDPYNSDFLMLGPDAHERNLERGLLGHIRQCLLELGVGFAFVGSQYRTIKALYFRTTGKPLDAIRLDDVAIPVPGAGQVRVRIQACALNPADWAVCEGFLPVPPPRGIGFDVA